MTGYTLTEIATALSAELVGDGSVIITGAAEPARATADQIAVAMDPRYADTISKGNARAAVLWQGADWQVLGLDGAVLIDRPRVAMASLTRQFGNSQIANSKIHPTALIDPTATIGENANIGPYTLIGENVVIGKNAQIEGQVSISEGVHIGDNAIVQSGARIRENVRIGDNFLMHPGASIGADGFSFVTAEKSAVENVGQTFDATPLADPDQDWLKIYSLGSVVIGDNVEVGANTNIDAGTLRPTRIGNGTKIDALVHVAHNVVVGTNCLLCGQVGIAGSAVIGDNVVLAGQVGVGNNVTVGDGVIGGGASKIISNVPAGRAVLGYPAVKMDSSIESYKALRRLPRLFRDFKKLQQRLTKIEDKN